MFCNIVPKKSLHFRINLELVFLNVVNEEATVKTTTDELFLNGSGEKRFLGDLFSLYMESYILFCKYI